MLAEEESCEKLRQREKEHKALRILNLIAACYNIYFTSIRTLYII